MSAHAALWVFATLTYTLGVYTGMVYAWTTAAGQQRWLALAAVAASVLAEKLAAHLLGLEALAP